MSHMGTPQVYSNSGSYCIALCEGHDFGIPIAKGKLQVSGVILKRCLTKLKRRQSLTSQFLSPSHPWSPSQPHEDLNWNQTSHGCKWTSWFSDLWRNNVGEFQPNDFILLTRYWSSRWMAEFDINPYEIAHVIVSAFSSMELWRARSVSRGFYGACSDRMHK